MDSTYSRVDMNLISSYVLTSTLNLMLLISILSVCIYLIFVRCAYPSRLRGKNIFDSSSTELTCAEHYSRLTYILILFFSSCFMVTAIGYLIYFKRKHFPCHKERKGHYIAVYTNDDANADEGSSVKITTADDESLVNNEEITVFENKTVQYFDV